MDGKGISLHRGSRRDQFSARYLRLRDRVEFDLSEREEDEREGDDERFFSHEDSWSEELQIDSTWLALRERLQAAVPFNPALARPLAPRPRGAVDEHTPGALLVEQELLELLEACARPMDEAHLGGPLLDECILSGPREALADELAALHQHLFDRAPRLAVALLLFRRSWIRTPQTWSGGEPLDLVEHLLVRYPIPRFVLRPWRMSTEEPSPPQLAWLVLLGQGGSPRRFGRLARDYVSWQGLSKKFLSQLTRVPSGLTLSHGLMYAEVLRLGGGPDEYRRLRRDPSYLLRPLDPFDPLARDQAFCRAAVVWLHRHREELDDGQAHRVLMWARHEQRERQRGGDGDHDWNARGFAATLAAADRYQREFVWPNRGWARRSHTRARARPALNWSRRGWAWTLEHAGERWEFCELTTTAELAAESEAMSHCVRIYDRRCVAGESVIVSLQRAGSRCLTLEIDPRSCKLVQVYGKYNRDPKPDEGVIVERWRASVLKPEPARREDAGLASKRPRR